MDELDLADLNILYTAFRRSMKGSSWKTEPQRFEYDFLHELVKLKGEIRDRNYKTLPGTEFTLKERGKIRHIHGGRMRDRVTRHALCDEVLGPKLHPLSDLQQRRVSGKEGRLFRPENV